MDFARRTFDKGWVPDADNVNGPENGLLRMDNLILDELGVLALRKGTAKINSGAFADADVHSLFTVFRNGLSGTRYRYAGAGAAVYRNGVSLGVTLAGSDDIAFGSHLGQVLMARSTSRYKDDGTTTRNLGIAMTAGAPSVVAALAANANVLASWDSSETALHSIQEDDGTGLSYEPDRAAVANGAAALYASIATLRGIITKTFAADQDFSIYTGPIAATDSDIFSVWVNIINPSTIANIILLIDVNGGNFYTDFYYKAFEITSLANAETGSPNANPNDPGSGDGDGGGDPILI